MCKNEEQAAYIAKTSVEYIIQDGKSEPERCKKSCSEYLRERFPELKYEEELKEIVSMRKMFESDEDFYYGWIANIAMLLHDRYQRADFEDRKIRTDAAVEIMNLLFWTYDKKAPKLKPPYV